MKKTNVHRLLDKEKVEYKIHEYTWKEDQLDAESAAENAGIPMNKVFKTLVTVGDKTGPIVACIRADDELDLKALAKQSGNKKVEMLPMKELEKITGYIRGGCSPIGMKRSYPTFISDEALKLESLIISAGRRGSQVEMQAQQLQKLTGATFADITMK